MSEAKSARPTPGPWELWDGRIVADRRALTIGTANLSALLSDDEKDANARLMAEAGTVYHETQLTPRELADQRAELLAVLITVRDNMRKGVTGQEARKGWDLVNAAIANAGAT